MTARQIYAVLAAGIENPHLFERWQKNPGSLRAYGIDPDCFDLDALRKFAGLTVKVRHNGLREWLPMTFRLLNVAGLEIEVFAAYAIFRASKNLRYAATTEERTDDLMAFLEHWLNFSNTEHALLWDMIRHEQALAQLNQPAPGEVCMPAVSEQPLSGASIPGIHGEIILYEMQSNPAEVALELRKSKPQLTTVLLEDHYFCYWRTGEAREIITLELDAFGYYVLTFVNGDHTIGDISYHLGGGHRPTPDFLRAITELAAVGIVEFRPTGR